MTGRTPPPLQELLFSSGIAVQIRKVSPYTLDAVQRQYPPPAPPIVRNDYGEGVIREEPNPADPGYAQALQDHKRLLSDRVSEAMLRLGVVVDIDVDALAAFKAEMAELGVTLTGDDRVLYLKHLVMLTEDDMTAMANAITRKNTPTAEAVQEHLATFPGDVQRSGSDGDRAAQVGD